MARVFLISPLPAVRAGLRALLAQAGGLEVVGEAAAPEALASTEGAAADVIVLDAAPGLEVTDLPALAGAASVSGAAGIVLLGPIAGDAALPATLAGRAWAYLPRDASPEQLLGAVEAVTHDLVVVERSLAGRLMRGERAAGELAPAGLAGAQDDLTPREREVLELVALGLPNKTVARRLGISEHTAKFHVAALMAKLGAASRTEAVRLAAQRGLVTL